MTSGYARPHPEALWWPFSRVRSQGYCTRVLRGSSRSAVAYSSLGKAPGIWLGM